MSVTGRCHRQKERPRRVCQSGAEFAKLDEKEPERCPSTTKEHTVLDDTLPRQRQANPEDFITRLTTADGAYLAKHHTTEGSTDYGNATWFTSKALPINSI